MSSQSFLEKCCLIGQPVAENPTHYMIEQAIRQDEWDWRFLTFEVGPEALVDALRGIRGLGFRGTKIAEPHGVAAMELVDELTEMARLAQSINSVTREEDGRLIGDNTIGHALIRLWTESMPPAERQIAILGAGRVGRVAAVAAALAGARQIVLLDRDATRAEELARSLTEATSAEVMARSWPETPWSVDPELALLIHATSLGATHPLKPLPILPDSLREDLGLVDVSFDPPGTWLLHEATRRGAATIDGLTLLVEQTALALEDWSGIDADRSVMREAAEEFLEI